MTIKLRPYQAEGVGAVHEAHGRGVVRPAGIAATGAGKTIMLAEVARTSRHGAAGGRRTLIAAHRQELVEQNADKVRDVAPDLRTGIVMGTRNETQGHVISASVQTLAGRMQQLRDIGLVIVDEAHHAAADSYLSVLSYFGCMGPPSALWPGPRAAGPPAVALGVTATMSRGDERALGDVWQEIVFNVEISDLVAQGFLVRPVGHRVRVDDLDLGKVRKLAGDFNSKGLGAAVEGSMAPKKIAEALREHAPDRQTILFAPLVSTAYVICEVLRESGFTAEVVHGKTPKEERKRILQAYRDGRVQVLCNAMVFTEGTDLPMTSCVVLARPTLQPALFVQMVGRGLRLWPGKTDCIVLDVVGATGRHRLAASVDLWGDEGLQGFEDDETPIDVLDPDDIDREADAIEQGLIETALGLDDLPRDQSGKLVTEIVDLFEGSDAGWLRTYAGVWCLAAPERYVAVLPRVDGGYGVVSIHRTRVGDSRWIMERVGELSYAMAHAQGDISDSERGAMAAYDAAGSKAKLTAAGWRRESPRGEAKRLGLPLSPDATPGQIRKQLAVAYASARIDRALPAWVRR